MITFDDISFKYKKLKINLEELYSSLKISTLQLELKNLESIASKEDFWKNIEMKSILKTIKSISNTIKIYNDISFSLKDISEFLNIAIDDNDYSMIDDIFKNIQIVEKKIEDQTISTLFSYQYDKNNAIITLHAGSGGKDAQDWTQMLYRMYTRWAEFKKFKISVISFLDGEEAGLKSISLTIIGQNAYGLLKSEVGVHRLIRISPFDSSGQRHTSFASVEVVPEIDDDIIIDIKDTDLKIDTFRASGAGGQHINKTESAVRIVHIPTGITVSCQTQRSQGKNKSTCLKVLKSKLFEIKQQKNLEKIEDIKGFKKEISWGSQIRSYTFMPYTLVKDHRTNYEEGNISSIMDGNIDGFIKAYLKKEKIK